MSGQQTNKAKQLLNTIFGREPAPPIGGHAAPIDRSDRRQFYAILISFVLIVALGIIVSQYELFDFSMREIPADEQLPGREVITPTAAP